MKDQVMHLPVEGTFSSIEVAAKITQHLTDEHPPELFLTELSLKYPEKFNAALRVALIDCGAAYLPGEKRLKRFADHDINLIDHCFGIHGDSIKSAASYQTRDQYKSRSFRDLMHDLTKWNIKDLPRAELRSRLETNPELLNDVLKYRLGENPKTIEQWFNPLIGDSASECISILSIVLKNSEHAKLAKGFSPDFRALLEHPSSEKVDKVLFAYLSFFEDPQAAMPGVGLRPVSRALSRDIGSTFGYGKLAEAITNFATRNSDGIYAQYVTNANLLAPGNVSILQTVRNELIKLMNVAMKGIFEKKIGVHELVSMVAATSFLANPDFKYVVSPESKLVDKVFSNPLVPKHLLISLIEQFREIGQCSNSELVGAACDELFKYSVISNFVSLQYFVDHARDKTVAAQILESDLGL
jgi:hypothetical protein